MVKRDSVPQNSPRLSQEIDELTLITTGSQKVSKRTKSIDEDEPLVDTTAALPLRSKKTERAQKRLQKKQQRAAQQPVGSTFFDLPPELLQEVLTHLLPSDIFRLHKVSRSVRHFLLQHQDSVARDIVKRRYWVLSQCFPLPVAFKNVDSTAQPALLSERRQDMLKMHKTSYQHVKGIDPMRVCTCMNCVFAWNNLCLLLDLSYWQKELNSREPIKMIPRGTFPDWNKHLLDANAGIVEKAMTCRIFYAMILEKHLKTTVGTILRTFRGKKTVHPRRLYHLTPAEAGTETDEFLERSGPPSYEYPWHRDNYYALEAYVPNRKWSKEKEQWVYYAEGQHERDLQWVKERFTPSPPSGKSLDDFIANFKNDRRLCIPSIIYTSPHDSSASCDSTASGDSPNPSGK